MQTSVRYGNVTASGGGALREIILDTETTGLDPANGDRIVEIGAVEVLNAIPTGAVLHVYLNPERDMPDAAFRVHGLSSAFLADKPTFRDVVDEFCAFLGEDRVVAHNASFDVAFINAELARCGRPLLPQHRVVDTLAIARRKHGGSNSLDALCARYGIDVSRRTKHGALLDAELLAEVYLELTGGRQAAFVLGAEATVGVAVVAGPARRARPAPLAPRLTAADAAAHAAFIATFSDPIWARLAARATPASAPSSAGPGPDQHAATGWADRLRAAAGRAVPEHLPPPSIGAEGEIPGSAVAGVAASAIPAAASDGVLLAAE
jgi:DNA polymerase-3 subunit epsilon